LQFDQGEHKVRPYRKELTLRPTKRSSPGRKIIIGVALIYPLLLLAVSFATLFFPQREGPLALAEVFAPYLFLPLVILLPLVFLRGALALRLALIACALVFVGRFLPIMSPSTPQADPKATQVQVMSWNLYKDSVPHDVLRQILSTKPADVVAFEEAEVEWLANDETIGKVYPYRMRYHLGAVRGLALLSAYPILDFMSVDTGAAARDELPYTWAVLDVGGGRRLLVVVAHPFSPERSDASQRGCWLSVCYDTAQRDEQIAQIRAAVDPILRPDETQAVSPISTQLRPGDPLILVGDFNVTDREPAYQDLSAGLTDAFRRVGQGFGHTWQPSLPVLHQGLHLLRIDYMFSSPNVTPLAMWADCTPRGSDHCSTHGKFELK